MRFDIVIRNGKIVDGTGNPWFRADIGIRDRKISTIGQLKGVVPTHEIDARGLVVCPGFIDSHSHSDSTVLFDNRLESTVRQGITTSVVGNCGESLAPVPPEKTQEFLRFFSMLTPPGARIDAIPWSTFHEYLDHAEQCGCAANIAHLVGFGAIRIAGGPGFEDRRATSQELQRMKSFVAEAMEAGAFGMSTGLIYAPQVFSGTDEIIELARVVGAYGGLYASHIRGEGETVVRAVKECIEIVENSGCQRGQISHHKIAGPPYWGESKETLRLIEEANARGVNVTCDQYPYDRGMTSLTAVLPPWAHQGGYDTLLERLKDAETRDRIKRDIMTGIEGWENWIKDGGFERIYLSCAKTKGWRDMEGKNLTEITRIKGKADPWETLFDIVLEEKAEVSITADMMSQEDIVRIMTHRYTMVGTDASGVSPTGVLGHGKPHPRYYGTYPRILGKYVRKEGLLTLEDAVRRMTSFPAQRFGLADRGLLKEGMRADLVILDPDTVIDRATYLEPHRFPDGIIHVLVNGEVVVENNTQTETLPGSLLRRTA
jgi:N-acyl-D-amino-acid deacylase